MVKKNTTSSPPSSPPPPHSVWRSGGGGTALVVVIRRVRFRVTWPRKIYSRVVVSTPSRRVYYIGGTTDISVGGGGQYLARAFNDLSRSTTISTVCRGFFAPPHETTISFPILPVRRPIYQSTYALCIYIYK